MIDMLLAWCRGTGSTEMENKAKGWLNATYRNWLVKARVQTEASRFQFTVTLGTTIVTAIPMDLLTIVNLRTLSRDADTAYAGVMEEKTPDEMDRMYPNRAATPNTGSPIHFSYRRISHPAETGAAGLWVCSTVTAAGGDFGQKVGIVGYPATDRSRILPQEVVLNGTTRVAVPTAVGTLLSFSKSANTVGYVQLYDAATAGNLLAELMPWERSGQRPVLEPYPYVDATWIFEMLYNRRPPPMTNDSDVPFYVSDEFHMGIVYSAIADWAVSFIDDDRLASAAAQAKDFEDRFMLFRRVQDRETAGVKWR